MPSLEPLPEGISLRVWTIAEPRTLVMESRGKWLHPLFELTAFLEAHPEISPGSLALKDRVIGRAAAFLIVRLGIREVETELISSRALALFASFGWTPRANTTIDKIGCQTEDLLEHEGDVEAAWRLLSARRNRTLAKL